MTRLTALFVAAATLARAAFAAPPLPLRLHETGLFVDGTMTVRAEVLPFAPQYPLWSDGTTKRRWIELPAGTAIDATRPEAWEFPVGTRLWKEFSFGRRVETRYIERLADGSWRFAAYLWNAEGTDARLVPEDGAVTAVAGAPGDRYPVPSRNDCLACHEGAAVPVLGFSALQLSPDRDPLAPHAEPARPQQTDLRWLVESGRLRNLPQQMLDTPPRIAASSPTLIPPPASLSIRANASNSQTIANPITAGRAARSAAQTRSPARSRAACRGFARSGHPGRRSARAFSAPSPCRPGGRRPAAGPLH